MTNERRPDRGFKDCDAEREQWEREGIELAQRHDATVFEIGDWYLRGGRRLGPGECRRIIEAPGWRGVKYDTAKVYACVARRYQEEFEPKHLTIALPCGTSAAIGAVDATADASRRRELECQQAANCGPPHSLLAGPQWRRCAHRSE